MAQKIEYPMFSPHPKAKLYKRFTGDMPIKVDDNQIIQIEMDGRIIEVADGGIITIQNNRYVFVDKFRWIESTSKDSQSEQPLDGLIVSNSYVTIRTNSLKEFDCGDIVELPKESRLGGLWTIEDGATVDYVYTPKQVQTYQYLPLSKVAR
ncbi:MAG: hypothetical protein K2L70_00715 [Clostridia bacterium]|nr:hypothetical protein [Clostridia bacterium]